MSDTHGNFHTHNGKTQNIRAWANESGILYQTLVNRLRTMSIDRALSLGNRTPEAARKAAAGAYDRGEVFTCGCDDCRERRMVNVKPRTQAERDARWRRETAARHAWRQSVRGEWMP